MVETAFGFKDNTQTLKNFLDSLEINGGHIWAVCLRSGTTLNKEALTILREHGVELIVRFGAGTDNIDLIAACENGILVQNTPGQNSTSVAEKTILCAMALSHNVALAAKNAGAILALSQLKSDIVFSIDDASSRIQFNKMISDAITRHTLKKSGYIGTELYGKTMGVIGCAGFIGAKVCTRAMGLGMKVLGFDPCPTREVEGVMRTNLADVLAHSDFVTVHVPLNSKTIGLFGSDQIALCQQKPRVLNLARAGIVDLDALHQGMTGKNPLISGYASDVDDPNHPIFSLPNTLCLPHIGAATIESESRCATMGANQVVAWLNSGEHKNGVNYPDACLGQGAFSLTVFHLDQPGMIQQISNCFAQRGKNIDTLHTISGKQGFACTMISLNEMVGADVQDELGKITGVIRLVARIA